MTNIFIDPIERTKIVTRWVKITLACLHIWASGLVIAALFGNNNVDLLIAMFSTCTFGIGATLIILLLDRGADVIINRFTTLPVTQVVETTNKTVTTQTQEGNADVSNAQS